VTTPHGIIRPRTPADLPAAAAALIEVHRTDGYPVEGVDDPQGWLTHPQQLGAWVAELDGEIVGHVAISSPQPDDAAATLWHDQTETPLDDIAVLGRLFVLPTARGHAFGRRLIETAHAASRDIGRRLVLDVMAKDTAAIALYERLHWSRIGDTEHPDGHGHTVTAHCYVAPHGDLNDDAGPRG
jgi:ribosomal protein S18 acetylase RimI-like enzyme